MKDALLYVFQIGTPILVGILIFFVQRLIKTLDRLDMTVAGIKIELSGNNASCRERHVGIDGYINENKRNIIEMSGKLSEHDKQISINKEKIESVM